MSGPLLSMWTLNVDIYLVKSCLGGGRLRVSCKISLFRVVLGFVLTSCTDGEQWIVYKHLCKSSLLVLSMSWYIFGIQYVLSEMDLSLDLFTQPSL